MKLEIELDLNQIDYEAINKQIQDKIKEMDIHKEYRIESMIKSKITEEVNYEVERYLKSNSWSGLNESSRRQITEEIYTNIKKYVEPHITDILNQIPQDELNNIISGLIPRVLVDVITTNMKDIMMNYYNSSTSQIYQICDEQIKNLLNRIY